MKHCRLQQNNGALSGLGRTVSVLAILLVGLVSYLAVNPTAHEFFHPDAGDTDHECVVTAFAASEGLFVPPQLDLRPASEVVRQIHLIAVEVQHDPLSRLLPPVCGPPHLRAIA